MINIAQIGVGYWGPNLLRNLVSNKDVNLKTVVDLSLERRQFVESNYPTIQTTANVNDVLIDASIQAIVISTPVETHFDLAIKALNAGKHILVEKPMATSSDEVKEIDQVAQKNKLIAMVGHTFLFNNTVRTIKKIIDDGELGDIRYIYSQRVNLGRIRSDVDALWNLAPHDISIIQYWLDEPNPIQVDRHGMSFVQEGIDDVVFMNIKYPNNVMANIHVSWLDPRKIRRMTVVGTKKMVLYDDIAENKITIFDKGIDRMAVLGENMDFDNGNTFTFQHRSGDVLMPKVNWIEPLKTEIAHFIDCAQNGTQCITDATHAEKVVRILEMGS
jgi:predicted dehydrogenase